MGIRDTRHVFFFEPSALRNELDVDLQFSKPFTEYSNIAYAPHDYSYSFTKTLPGGHEDIYGYNEALDTAWHAATKMKATVLVTEWGGSHSRLDRIRNISAAQGRHLTSSTFWLWKETGGGWSLWDSPGEPSAALRQDTVQAVTTVRPYSTAGSLLSYSYDCEAFAMEMRAHAPPGLAGTAAETRIYLPPLVNSSSIDFSVTGAATAGKVEVAPDGSRVWTVITKSEGGEYGATVR